MLRSGHVVAIALVGLLALSNVSSRELETETARDPIGMQYAPPPALLRELVRAAPGCFDGHGGTCDAAAVLAHTDSIADRLQASPRGPLGPGAWLAHALDLHGTVPAFGAVETSALPAREAILALYESLGYEPDTHILESMDTQLAALSADGRVVIEDILNRLVTAQRLVEAATRDVDVAQLTENMQRIHLVKHAVAVKGAAASPELQAEWHGYASQLVRIDRAMMAQAGLLVASIVPTWQQALPTDELYLPLIVIGNHGDTVYPSDLSVTSFGNHILLIDLSGNDTYLNNVGAPPLSGIAGIGVAIDEGDGDDNYDSAAGSAQGAATGGIGILFDEGGDDRYHVGASFGQGDANGGIGILYDAGVGHDRYTTPSYADALGTKAAAMAAVGILVDEGGDDYLRQDYLDGMVWSGLGGVALMGQLGDGNDTYVSKPALSEDSPLGPMNQTGPIMVSAEVGAVAVLYEEGGNDRYECGPRTRQPCLGAGGGGAIGILHDRAGDDIYTQFESVSGSFLPELYDVFAEAIPALENALRRDVRDATGMTLPGEPGEPQPFPLEMPTFPLGQGVGYGLGVPGTAPAAGILRDESGNDRYSADRWAQGYASYGWALGLLHDTGAGDDTYDMRTPSHGARTDDSRWQDGLGVGIGIDE